MSDIMRWSDLTQPTQQSGRVPAWLSPENREIARSEKRTRVAAVDAQNSTKLDMFKAELRRCEMEQTMSNATRLMQQAVNLADGNEGMLAELGQIYRTWVQTEALVYRTNHNPFFQ